MCRMGLVVWLTAVIAGVGGACLAQNMLTNPSFEQNLAGWSKNSVYSVQVVSSGWNGVTAASGNKFLAVSGPAQVGYTYAWLVSQTRSYPFGSGLPSDNFLLYLFARTYLHTNDGRNVSYAIVLEPGYGEMSMSFHGGSRDRWVTAHASGYYSAADPNDPSLPAKPIRVYLQLRDSLEAGEYLLLDAVELYYGGTGVPEATAGAEAAR